MAHALFQDAKGACIRCRKCGGHIEVRHPKASPVPPAPEVPSSLRYDPAPTAFPEIPEVVTKAGPVTAPVLPTENPLSQSPSSDALVPPVKPEPEEAVFSPQPPVDSQARDGVNKKIYTVYRIGYWNNKLESIGKVVERRKEERNNNAADMLRWAKKIYASASIDSNIFIVNEGSSGGPIFGGA